MREPTRRRFLSAAGTAGVAAVAGCSTSDAGAADASATDGTVVRASFFVFGDVASAVAGDAATAETLVPVGQHGHGWEPGPRVREAIREADLFVHGPDGFQPWADDVVRDLGADGAGVATVDASADVPLLETGGAGVDHADEDRNGNDADGHEHHGDSDRDEDHDHGRGTDPHFWMDPLRVEEAVGTVRTALADVDGANADRYAENADAYRGRIRDLHDGLASVVAEAPGTVVLVAGHDAFRYLTDRYGIEIDALTGLSPDDRPTAADVERARTVVDTHGLEYVCADPLESQRAAEQLVAETDAEAVLPLTAMPGLSDEWADEGWGYAEIMERVNRPTLERALGAR